MNTLASRRYAIKRLHVRERGLTEPDVRQLVRERGIPLRRLECMRRSDRDPQVFGALRLVAMRAHSVVHQLRVVLEMIKFEPTLFALPFALMGMLLAAGGWPPWGTVGWIVVAMVGARSAAMGWNRLIDRGIDAANPRTAGRALPAGQVTPAFVAGFVAASAALLVLAAWQLNPLALALS